MLLVPLEIELAGRAEIFHHALGLLIGLLLRLHPILSAPVKAVLAYKVGRIRVHSHEIHSIHGAALVALDCHVIISFDFFTFLRTKNLNSAVGI